MHELEDLDPFAEIERIRAKATPGSNAVAEYEREAAKRDTDRVERILCGWGVPKRIRRTTEAPQETKAVVLVREWMAQGEESWCLVLSADKGVGKSTAAGWWLREIAKDAQPTQFPVKRWWPGTEICAEDFYGDGFRQICEAGSIVLDDLGVEFADQKGMLLSKLDRLLDARYREYRRTIITTNLGVKQFYARYDGRIQDRLREEATWAGIQGESMRGRKE